MDLPRTPPRRRLRMFAGIAGACALAVAALAGSASLRAATPSVARAGVVMATVQRGEFLREVRASGRLVPQETLWVTAITPGRVDSITGSAGAAVAADTVILTLQNPDVVLAALEAEREVTTARATALELETRLGTQAIDEAASVAALEAELANAERRARVYGADLGLVVTRLEQVQMEDQATALGQRLGLARERVRLVQNKGGSAIQAWREQLSRRQKVAVFRRAQVDALAVRAGGDGILADIAVEPGQWAPPGAVLASVIKPDRLKAELRVPEGQAKDIAIGMSTQIDTHNGLIPGHVARVATTARDGAVLVEVALDGPLPAGARPELNVDGSVRVETIPDALYVERPAVALLGPCTLFRVSADGAHVERVGVTLGRASALAVEVRAGLAAGDRIIISDTSQLRDDSVALR